MLERGVALSAARAAVSCIQARIFSLNSAMNAKSASSFTRLRNVIGQEEGFAHARDESGPRDLAIEMRHHYR